MLTIVAPWPIRNINNHLIISAFALAKSVLTLLISSFNSPRSPAISPFNSSRCLVISSFVPIRSLAISSFVDKKLSCFFWYSSKDFSNAFVKVCASSLNCDFKSSYLKYPNGYYKVSKNILICKDFDYGRFLAFLQYINLLRFKIQIKDYISFILEFLSSRFLFSQPLTSASGLSG